MIYTVKTITNAVRAAAEKMVAVELTEEDKIFITNVLLDYAKRLDRRSDAIIRKGGASDEPHLAGASAYVMSRRVEREYAALIGQPIEVKRRRRTKKDEEETIKP